MIEAAKKGKISEILALLARRAEVDCRDTSRFGVSPCKSGREGITDPAIAAAIDQRESLGVSTGIRGRSQDPAHDGGGGHPLRLGLKGGAEVHAWAEAALARRRQAP